VRRHQDLFLSARDRWQKLFKFSLLPRVVEHDMMLIVGGLARVVIAARKQHGADGRSFIIAKIIRGYAMIDRTRYSDAVDFFWESQRRQKTRRTRSRNTPWISVKRAFLHRDWKDFGCWYEIYRRERTRSPKY
jgi:hypothetical protein